MDGSNPLEMSIWQCDCGHVEYGEYPPEECVKCWNINSFFEISEDDIESQEQDILEEMRGMEDE